jgi:hypothetical protein
MGDINTSPTHLSINAIPPSYSPGYVYSSCKVVFIITGAGAGYLSILSLVFLSLSICDELFKLKSFLGGGWMEGGRDF